MGNIYEAKKNGAVVAYITDEGDIVDSGGNVLRNKPNYVKGTWYPKLYDLDTFKKDLDQQVYYKIGPLYIMCLYLSSFPSDVTFNTMMQIRGLPCGTCLGGNIYLGGRSPSGGDLTIQTAEHVYLRPNVTGSINGGVASGIFFGV